MKKCPERGARIKSSSAVRCPACIAPLPAPRSRVGKHEIQSKSGRKPLIISDRRISSEIDNKAKRKRITKRNANVKHRRRQAKKGCRILMQSVFQASLPVTILSTMATMTMCCRPTPVNTVRDLTPEQ